MSGGQTAADFVPPDVSILIPAYEMRGLGAQMLVRALASIENQTLSPNLRSVEVIVSDHSHGHSVYEAAMRHERSSKFSIRYFRNLDDRGSASANLNHAFQRSSGRIVKLLFQDDYLYSKRALTRIVDVFRDEDVSWVVCGCNHTFDGEVYSNEMVPHFHSRIHLGRNTISSPSVLAVRREDWLDFDRRLVWLMDVDLYQAMAVKRGLPTVIPDILVTNGLGGHQTTNVGVSRRRIRAEQTYVFFKHIKQSLGWS